MSAIEKAKKVARILKEKYHARETILFGTLIWRPDFLWSGTDIDLMVKGIDHEDYLKSLLKSPKLPTRFRLT